MIVKTCVAPGHRGPHGTATVLVLPGDAALKTFTIFTGLGVHHGEAIAAAHAPVVREDAPKINSGGPLVRV
jgi:hypothetical protein